MLNALAQELGRYLDVVSTRQKLVAQNIANVDTPGYQTQDVDFHAELRRAGTPEAMAPDNLPTKNDGNNVSLDRESRMLAENSIRFDIAAQLLKGQFQSLKEAIHEGKSL
jgi:flagellar basal-body rod protein FlgB